MILGDPFYHTLCLKVVLHVFSYSQLQPADLQQTTVVAC